MLLLVCCSRAALLNAAVLYNNISLDVDVRVVMAAMEVGGYVAPGHAANTLVLRAACTSMDTHLVAA